MNRKVRTALYACALMAPLLLQSCNAQSEKKESNKECTEETNKNTEKKVMKTGSENFIFAEGKEWKHTHAFFHTSITIMIFRKC